MSSRKSATPSNAVLPVSQVQSLSKAEGPLNVSDSLRLPVEYVREVGPTRAELLGRLGIHRAYDLLFFFPRDYLEIVLRRRVTDLTEDSVQSIAGVIVDYRSRYTRRGVIVTLFVESNGELVEGIWFNAGYVCNQFRLDRPLILTGKPKKTDGRWQFSHPRLTFLDTGLDLPWNPPKDESESTSELRYVLPVYSLTEGLSQALLQRVIRASLKSLPDLLPEALPTKLRELRNLAPIAEAIRLMHYPSTPEEAEYARRRFAYQELLVLQLALAICRMRRRVNMRAPMLPGNVKTDSRIRRLFPFEFTSAQNEAINDISTDMGRPSPMNRLLQGDVGSGKTAVAVYAALQATANGAQTVLMAPTETLARQHLRTFESLLSNSATRVVPFFGGQKSSERAEILAAIESGDAKVIVGTQALICNELRFKNLGLVIIDEQHKFGVKQRAMLKGASELEPHYLVMTATPIPRSLTMTFFGDLDVSVMRGSPPNRRPPTTSIVTNKTRDSWMAFVRARLDEGRQAFFVVPRVDNDGVDTSSSEEDVDFDTIDIHYPQRSYSSDDRWKRWDDAGKTGNDSNRLDALSSSTKSPKRKRTKTTRSTLKTVFSVLKELRESSLKGYRIGVLHGRLTSQEKEEVMCDFRDHKLDALVATSIVEVGIDVPNATLMTIENAEFFGLAQLHQLRGRISRGEYPGFCAVVPTETEEIQEEIVPEGNKATSSGKKVGRKPLKTLSKDACRTEALERLTFFAQSTDGFELAEKDLDLRGPGELVGGRQSGPASTLRIANYSRDRRLLEEARDDAATIVRDDPGLCESEHEALRRQVLTRYGRSLDLGDVG